MIKKLKRLDLIFWSWWIGVPREEISEFVDFVIEERKARRVRRD